MLLNNMVLLNIIEKVSKDVEWSLKVEKDKMEIEKDQILYKYRDELEKWLKDRKNQEIQKIIWKKNLNRKK